MIKSSIRNLAVAFAILGTCLFPHLQAIGDRELRPDVISVDASDTISIKAGNLLNQSVIAIQQNKWQEARSLLESAQGLGPNKLSKDIEGNLAVVLEHFGQFDLAFVCLKKAYALAPTDGNVLEQLAAYHQQIGDYPQALKYLETYLKLYPKAADLATISRIANHLKGRPSVSSMKVDSEDYFAEATRANFCRFHLPHEPLKVFIDSGTNVKGYKKDYRDFLVKALDIWTEASKALTWRSVDDKADADIVCLWSDQPETISGGKFAEGGESRSQYLDHEIKTSVLTILTVPLKGVVLNDETVDSGCLHEVGHALGLIDHSPNYSDVMFATLSEQPRLALSARDKATIARLYKSELPSP